MRCAGSRLFKYYINYYTLNCASKAQFSYKILQKYTKMNKNHLVLKKALDPKKNFSCTSNSFRVTKPNVQIKPK